MIWCFVFIVSHFLWARKVCKKLNFNKYKNTQFFTRSDWVFYFLSKKDLKVSNCSIFSGYPIKDYNDHLFSEKIHNHIINLTRSCFNDDIYYKDFDIKISFESYFEDLNKWIYENNIKEIYLPYVSQGNWNKIYKKIIKKYENINFIKFNRKYDINSWIYSKKGYFKFKQNIPELIRDL